MTVSAAQYVVLAVLLVCIVGTLLPLESIRLQHTNWPKHVHTTTRTTETNTRHLLSSSRRELPDIDAVGEYSRTSRLLLVWPWTALRDAFSSRPRTTGSESTLASSSSGALTLPDQNQSNAAARKPLINKGPEVKSIWEATTSPAARKPGENKLWLYVSIGAHFPDAALMLQHHMHHYLDTLKFPVETFLVMINFKSDDPEHAAEYERIKALLAARGVSFLPWNDEFSSAAHMVVKYKLLRDKNMHPEDWIVLTDLDEFNEYPNKATAPEFFKLMDEQNYTYVHGDLVDRVSATGKLNQLTLEPSIEEQMPLMCNIVHRMYKGLNTKAVGMKAYFRSDQGNHNVIWPAFAQKRFARNYDITPYSYLGLDKYCLADTDTVRMMRRNTTFAAEVCGNRTYYVRQYPARVPIMHYKWHNGMVASATRRHNYYSGKITANGTDAGANAKPLTTQCTVCSGIILDHLKSHGGLDVTNASFQCHRAGTPAPPAVRPASSSQSAKQTVRV